MKKLILGLMLVSSLPSFGGVVAGLQYICDRADRSVNSDVKTIRVYHASGSKVFIDDYGLLLKEKFKRVKKSIVITYDASYENDNVLTISLDERPSSLVIGARTVEMVCKSF